MIKQELVNHIALETGQTKAAVQMTIDALAVAVQRQLARGGDVLLTNFGKFHVIKKAARAGRNPRTGEFMPIKARRVVKFTAGKRLADAIHKP